MKSITFILFALIGLTIACYPDANLNEDPDILFQKFVVRCGKSYATGAEQTKRLGIFKTNLQKIKTLNAATPAGVPPQNGINVFADWTEDEFLLKNAGGKAGILNDKLNDLGDGACDVNKSKNFKGFNRTLDYSTLRCIAPMRTQGNCASDWAFAVADHLADNYCLASGEWCPLSAQQLIDCTTTELGCRGGFQVAPANYVRGTGLMRDFDYPYTAVKAKCKYDKTKAIHKDVTAHRYPVKSEDEMRNTLDKRYTFIVTMDVSGWQFIVGDVVIGENNPKECCKSNESKYVQVVGYGVNERGVPYWLIKNSWGPGWGNNGYTKVIAGKHCYKLTRRFAYTPLKTLRGECIKAGPIPVTTPAPEPTASYGSESDTDAPDVTDVPVDTNESTTEPSTEPPTETITVPATSPTERSSTNEPITAPPTETEIERTSTNEPITAPPTVPATSPTERTSTNEPVTAPPTETEIERSSTNEPITAPPTETEIERSSTNEPITAPTTEPTLTLTGTPPTTTTKRACTNRCGQRNKWELIWKIINSIDQDDKDCKL